MRQFLLLACLSVSAAGLSVAPAAADQYAIEVFGKGDIGQGELGCLQGGVRWVPKPGGAYVIAVSDWEFVPAGSGTAVRARKGKGKWQYLTYDPTGKEKGVFLAEELTDGACWKTVEGIGDKTFQAARGKVAGWYLDISPKGEKVRGSNGKEYTVHPLILSEERELLERCRAYPIAP